MTGICNWKCFQKLSNAVEYAQPPHITRNEQQTQVPSDTYGVSFTLDLSSLSREDISRSVKQTSTCMHFRCAVIFYSSLSDGEGQFTLYLAT